MVECCLLQVALHDQVGGCQNFWRAKPEYVQQYGLATVIPQDVQEVLAVARARQRPRRGGEHLPPNFDHTLVSQISSAAICCDEMLKHGPLQYRYGQCTGFMSYLKMLHP